MESRVVGNQYTEEEPTEEYVEEDEPIDEIALEAQEETSQTGIDEEDREVEVEENETEEV